MSRWYALSVGGVVTRGWGGAVFGWVNCCSWVAVYAYRLADGDVAPALGVKEGMGEGSGLLSFLLRISGRRGTSDVIVSVHWLGVVMGHRHVVGVVVCAW